MCKKRIYVGAVNGSDEWTEAERVGTAEEFKKAREAAAIAADELREKGNKADDAIIYRSLVRCFMSLPDARTERAAVQILACIRYIEGCYRGSVAIYWPYVQNRILDFLEAEYFSVEYMEVK